MLLLFLIVIALIVALVRMQDAQVKARESIDMLRRRIEALETAVEKRGRVDFSEVQAAAVHEGAAAPMPVAASPSASAAPPPAAPGTEASTPGAPTAGAPAPAARHDHAPAPAATHAAAPHEPAPTPVAAPPEPAAAAPAHEPDEAWEVVVGTSWLNKIGVVVFVVGLALLLGYSMAHVGPLGRVAMGYAISLTMLGAGVTLERRDPYRTYAYGLVGGGWAGLYFTTYAMHALPAARVVESDLIGSLSLMLVAAGIIGHSLRYRAQTVTALAYVAAYAPLAFSPLTGFSLAAAVPLTASLLVVSARLGWPALSVLGVACAYALVLVRTAGLATNTGEVAFHLVLWFYWLLFEAADLLARTGRPGATQTRAAAPALFALNAAGFVGLHLLHSVADREQWLEHAAVAGAYLVTAIVRARIDRAAPTPDGASSTRFTSVHGATAIAAALLAYATDLRLHGAAQTIAFLVETQLLVAAGLALADRQVRQMAAVMALVTSAHAFGALAADLPAAGFHAPGNPSLVGLIVATLWYVNHAWIARRRGGISGLEHAYTWLATFLIVNVEWHVVPRPFIGAVTAGTAALATAFGAWKAHAGFRWQGYVLAAIASLVPLARLIVDSAAAWEHHASALSVIAFLYIVGYTGRSAASAPSRPEQTAAGFIALLGGLVQTVFVWRVVPDELVGFVWIGSAAVLLLLGARRARPWQRWQSYALFALGMIRVLFDIAGADTHTLWAALAILIVYGAALGLRGVLARVQTTAATLEGQVRVVLLIGATALLSALLADAFGPRLATFVWALQGAALLFAGFLVRERALRLLGLLLLFVCIFKLFVYDLRELEALARIMSFVALGLVLLGVSWVYTRYREDIRKLL